MAFVKTDERVVLVGEVANALEVCDNAVHRERAVRENHDVFRSRRTRFLKLGFEVRHVVIFVAETHRLAEAHTVDNRSVVEFVGNNRVAFLEEAFEETAVRVEARAVEDRVFGFEEFGNRGFELLVNRLRAANEADGRATESVLVERFVRRLDDVRIVRKPEVVVRAHIDDFAPVFEANVRRLRAGDHAFFLVKPGFADFGEASIHRFKIAFVCHSSSE